MSETQQHKTQQTVKNIYLTVLTVSTCVLCTLRSVHTSKHYTQPVRKGAGQKTSNCQNNKNKAHVHHVQ